MTDIYSLRIDDVKTGGYIILKDIPCKVINMRIFTVGRHGRRNVIIKANELFSRKKHCLNFDALDIVTIPIIKTRWYLLLHIDEYECEVFDDDDDEVLKFSVPTTNSNMFTEIGELYVKEEIEIEIMHVMGVDQIINYRIDTRKDE